MSAERERSTEQAWRENQPREGVGRDGCELVVAARIGQEEATVLVVVEGTGRAVDGGVGRRGRGFNEGGGQGTTGRPGIAQRDAVELKLNKDKDTEKGKEK